MKKVLSLTLALVMLVATVSATATAQANMADSFEKKVEQVKTAAAQYIVKNDIYTDYSDVKNISALWTLIKSGSDMSSVKDSFAANIKSNLDQNGGKIIVTGENWYEGVDGWYSEPYSYEDVAVYGAAILVLDNFGYDTTDFEGYNIQTVFKNFDLSLITNPYSYRVAVEAATDIVKDAAFTATLISDMQTRYYTMGSGIDNWGYSCDNTAQMLLTIGNQPARDDYSALITDAKSVIKNYTKENGAYADDFYVTTVNADSTALAMGGYAAVEDVETANWYYEKLIENFYNKSTGAFTTDGQDNMYATKDALLGLIYFENAVKTVHIHDTTCMIIPASLNRSGMVITERCKICGKVYDGYIINALANIKLQQTKFVYNGKNFEPTVIVTDVKGDAPNNSNDYYSVKYSNNKAVGTATATISFKDYYDGTFTRKFVINPKGTSLTGVTAAKKGFTAKWSKQATQTTGYQLQYSTNKNFKNAKTVTVKNNKTLTKKVTKLAAGKKYFVRVRTYKTVSGKNYYSRWSAAKTVTTKK